MRLVLANLAGTFGKAVELKRKPVTLLLLILVGGALLRVYTLAAESFYFDEAYSVWAARHSVIWLVSLSTQRIFPPLYYLLLHFWLVLGESEFAVRLLSVVLGLGSIVAIYTLAKQLFDTRVGLLSAFLLAISPLHLWFSQEARMYMLVLTLSLCSANFLLLALREGRRWHWLAYVLTTALAMNTHYFTLFLALFENAYVLYLLLRQRLRSSFWKHWVLVQLAVGLLSAIGLAGVFSEETDYWWGLLDTWHGAATWRDVLSIVLKFSLGPQISGRLAYVVALLLFGCCAVWALVSLRPSSLSTPETRYSVPRSVRGPPAGARRPAARLEWQRLSLAWDDGLVFTLLYLVVPIGAIFLVSQFRSFWVLRYLFPFLPPYCVLTARGIARMPGRALPALVTIAIVLASLWPISDIYRSQQKEDWRGAVQYIAAHEQPGDVLLMVDEDLWLPFEHYYHGSMSHLGISRTITERDFLAARVGLAASSHKRIWLVLSHTENQLVKDYLMTSGYTELASEKYFMNVEVDLFTVQSFPAAVGRDTGLAAVGWSTDLAGGT
jgi:4-amino-4-deoxy-L-arabinose transferase-like glycosyltransferase